MFARPTFRERLYALNVFLRTFAFVTIRRIVDYDNMPLLTKEAGFSGLNVSDRAALHLDVCPHPRQPRDRHVDRCCAVLRCRQTRHC